MNHNHTCIWMHMNSCMFSRNFWHKTRWVHVLMPEIKLMWLMCSCLTGEWFVIYKFSVSSHRPNGISFEDLLELSIFLQKSSSSFEAEDLDSASVWHYAHYETWSDEVMRDEKMHAAIDRVIFLCMYDHRSQHVAIPKSLKKNNWLNYVPSKKTPAAWYATNALPKACKSKPSVL